MTRFRSFGCVGLVLLAIGASAEMRTAAAAPPKVVKAVPDNGDNEVDPALKQLRIEFDQDMQPGGFSICGAQGLEIAGKPRWASERIFVLPVKLNPGQKVELSVNCPGAQNFKSTAGEAAEPYPITFEVLPAGATPRPAITLAQKRTAISRLRRAIDDHYAYRDLRGVDWPARFEEFTPRMEQADIGPPLRAWPPSCSRRPRTCTSG